MGSLARSPRKANFLCCESYHYVDNMWKAMKCDTPRESKQCGNVEK